MKSRKEILVDGYTRFCLTAIVVLLAALVLCVWVQQGTILPSANAADDAPAAANSTNWGAQSSAMVKAQDQTNARLDELIKLLKSGEVKVQTTSKGGGDDSK